MLRMVPTRIDPTVVLKTVTQIWIPKDGETRAGFDVCCVTLLWSGLVGAVAN